MILKREEKRAASKVYKDKKIDAMWMIWPGIVFILGTFFAGGSLIFDAEFFKENLLFIVISLAALGLPLTNSSLEEEWNKILYSGKAAELNHFSSLEIDTDYYYTDSFFDYFTHRFVRIYTYILDFALIMAAGIMGYSWLHQALYGITTVETIMLILLVAIAWQLYGISKKL